MQRCLPSAAWSAWSAWLRVESGVESRKQNRWSQALSSADMYVVYRCQAERSVQLCLKTIRIASEVSNLKLVPYSASCVALLLR